MSRFEKPDRLPVKLPAEPMALIELWFKEAGEFSGQRNPNAMTIASVGDDGRPSARTVLCKDFVPDPGYLVFYTNYQSRKAAELQKNRRAAALFHWDALGRQIRIDGVVHRSPELESDDYFASRDVGSQLGAWGSDQSASIDSREALVAQIQARANNLGLALETGTQVASSHDNPRIDRPPHWGGFRLWATSVELWVEGADRVHDRGVWSRDVRSETDGCFTMTPWIASRIQP